MALLKLNGYSGEAEIDGITRRISVDKDGLHIHGVTLEEASDLLHTFSSGTLRAYQPGGEKISPTEFVFTAREVGAPEPKKACECGDECRGHQEQAKAEPPKTRSFADDIAEVKASLHHAVHGTPDKEPVDESPKEEPEKKEPEKKEPAPKRTRRTRAAAPSAQRQKASVVEDMTADPEDTVTGSAEDPEEKPAVEEDDNTIIVDDDESESTQDESSGEEVVEDEPEPEPEPEPEADEPQEEPAGKAPDATALFGELLAAATMRDVLLAFQDHGITKLSAIQKEAAKLQATVPLLKNAGDALPVRITRTAKGMGIK